jgi:hypothetical protein
MLIMQVDGSVLDVFSGIHKPMRVPLAWVIVRAQPQRKGGFMMTIGQNWRGGPLYALGTPESSDPVGVLVGAEEEPAFRAFFTELAQLCGRQVEPPSDS